MDTTNNKLKVEIAFKDANVSFECDNYLLMYPMVVFTNESTKIARYYAIDNIVEMTVEGDMSKEQANNILHLYSDNDDPDFH